MISLMIICLGSCVSKYFVLFADCEGQQNKYALIQYLFDGPEVQIKIRPHGNSKANQPFFCTSASTRKRISELAISSTPKAVITELTREKGGEPKARGFAALRCDRQQVSYARQRSYSSSHDPLYSIMLECKLAQGSSGKFVQDVKAAQFHFASTLIGLKNVWNGWRQGPRGSSLS